MFENANEVRLVSLGLDVKGVALVVGPDLELDRLLALLAVLLLEVVHPQSHQVLQLAVPAGVRGAVRLLRPLGELVLHEFRFGEPVLYQQSYFLGLALHSTLIYYGKRSYQSPADQAPKVGACPQESGRQGGPPPDRGPCPGRNRGGEVGKRPQNGK
jgi:hypothetical protein